MPLLWFQIPLKLSTTIQDLIGSEDCTAKIAAVAIQKTSATKNVPHSLHVLCPTMLEFSLPNLRHQFMRFFSLANGNDAVHVDVLARFQHGGPIRSRLQRNLPNACWKNNPKGKCCKFRPKYLWNLHEIMNWFCILEVQSLAHTSWGLKLLVCFLWCSAQIKVQCEAVIGCRAHGLQWFRNYWVSKSQKDMWHMTFILTFNKNKSLYCSSSIFVAPCRTSVWTWNCNQGAQCAAALLRFRASNVYFFWCSNPDWSPFKTVGHSFKVCTFSAARHSSKRAATATPLASLVVAELWARFVIEFAIFLEWQRGWIMLMFHLPVVYCAKIQTGGYKFGRTLHV